MISMEGKAQLVGRFLHGAQQLVAEPLLPDC